MTRHKSNRGMTLIEVVIAGAIMAVILSVTYLVLLSAQDAYATGVTQADLQNQGRIVMSQILNELRQAGLSTIVIGLASGEGDQSITFQTNTGYDGTQIVWSSPITFSSEMALNEINNGIDDNGNGIIDERSIVRIQDGDSVSITDWLREGTMTFTLTGSTVEVRFQLGRIDPDERPIQVTSQASVDIRNP